MKNEKDMLRKLLKSTQLGQTEIRSVLDVGMNASLRASLSGQLREYETLESEIHTIAAQRGWELPELDPARRFITDRKIRMKLTHGNCDSRIADLLIRNNTDSMIRNLKNLHHYPQSNDRISVVAQRLVDCETANIRTMHNFL